MVESPHVSGRASSAAAEHSCDGRTIVHGAVAHRVVRHVRRHLAAFGRAVAAIWPIKPALHLAQLEHCSERAAQYQIDGERKPSARAIVALDQVMLDQ